MKYSNDVYKGKTSLNSPAFSSVRLLNQGGIHFQMSYTNCTVRNCDRIAAKELQLKFSKPRAVDFRSACVSRLSAAHRHGRGYSKGVWTGQAKTQGTDVK